MYYTIHATTYCAVLQCTILYMPLHTVMYYNILYYTCHCILYYIAIYYTIHATTYCAMYYTIHDIAYCTIYTCIAIYYTIHATTYQGFFQGGGGGGHLLPLEKSLPPLRSVDLLALQKKISMHDI